ncbi:hypothetical protein AMTR_s00002p00250510 [Amborella trichopoda]|uniref:Uncharacterized protein n=1 Tax=Amborella trichopoda TaxID=13333 RepID=W1NUI1_AMBTC|nr:hypothetical protein AMTR_s00002p00250510 [Amborella trichopoda]
MWITPKYSAVSLSGPFSRMVPGFVFSEAELRDGSLRHSALRLEALSAFIGF